MFYQPLFSTSAAAETECVPVFLSLFKVTFQGPVTADTGRIQTQYFTKRRDAKWRESQFCVSELFR